MNVITYDTYDLFHYCHLRLLKRTKELGDRLIVAVSTDDFNEIKGKECVYPHKRRSGIIAGIKYADFVFPKNNWEQKKEDIKKYGINLLVMGDNWEDKLDHLKPFCEVKYLPRTQGISTTRIKNIG